MEITGKIERTLDTQSKLSVFEVLVGDMHQGFR